MNRLNSLLIVAAALGCAGSGARAQALPADDSGAVARLNASPRHGEWVSIAAGGGDSLRAWLVYPERQGRAPAPALAPAAPAPAPAPAGADD